MQICFSVGVDKFWKLILFSLLFADILKVSHAIISKNAKKSSKRCERSVTISIKVASKSVKVHILFVDIFAVDADYRLRLVFSKVAIFKFLSDRFIIKKWLF